MGRYKVDLTARLYVYICVVRKHLQRFLLPTKKNVFFFFFYIILFRKYRSKLTDAQEYQNNTDYYFLSIYTISRSISYRNSSNDPFLINNIKSRKFTIYFRIA